MMQGSKQIALVPSAMAGDCCQGAGRVAGSEAAVGRGVCVCRGRMARKLYKLSGGCRDVGEDREMAEWPQV